MSRSNFRHSSDGFSASPASPMGTYNSARRTPAPRLTASRSTLARNFSQSGQVSATIPHPSAKSSATDPYVTKVVVMLDEATEPGLSEADAARHRDEIIAVLSSRKKDMPIPTSSVTPGQAVAFALRKRLKSDNRLAVLSTLILLDELMRSVPYFYRNVANDKFFRRLWRFVVPDYKNQLRTFIPLFQKPQLNTAMRGSDSQISERVKILIRAWAEELSIMFHGRYDPDAGFLIERYRNKRTRVPFPEVPSTATPWVCAVPGVSSSRAGRSSRSGSSSRTRNLEKITLAEVENTANLFSNLLDKATDIKELRDDLCTDLAGRCQSIVDNLAHISANMDKEEELARAIKVSELLQSSLARYKKCIETGRIVNEVPTVDSDALESDDEMYDVRPPARRTLSAQSLDDTAVGGANRSSAYPKRSVSFSRVSVSPDGRHSSRTLASGDLPPRPRRRISDGSSSRDEQRERRGEGRGRERRDERDRRDDRERRDDERRDDDRERRDIQRRDSERREDKRREDERREDERREDERERRNERNHTTDREGYRPWIDRDRQERDNERREPERDSERDRDRERTVRRIDTGETKAERRRVKAAAATAASLRRQKSDGDLPTRRRGSASVDGERGSLIDLADAGSTPSDDTAPDAEASEAFTLLAERYTSGKGEKSRSRNRKSKSGSSKPSSKPSTSASEVPTSTTGSMPLIPPGVPPPPMGMAPGAMYQSQMPGMGFNPMMMMPSHNPYAMYSSINPMGASMGGDPMGMFSAYNTVNPAMYYSSISGGPGVPGMIPGMNPNMMAVPSQAQSQQQSVTAPVGASTAMSTGTSSAPKTDTSSTSGATQPSLGAGMMAVPPVPVAPVMESVSTPPQQPQPQMPPQMGSFYGSVSGPVPGMMAQQHGAMMPMGGAHPSGGEANQAAAYSAMQQAAAAYHMAANAYRSIQGQSVPTNTAMAATNMGGGSDTNVIGSASGSASGSGSGVGSGEGQS